MKESSKISARRLRRAVAVALGTGMAIAAQASPAVAQGAEALHLSYRGNMAEARFIALDESGCVLTDSFVHAVDGRVKMQPGRPDADLVAFVGIARVNQCTQQLLSLAMGTAELTSGAFETDRYDNATLATTVGLTDLIGGSSFVVNVDLRWTGTGERERSREHVIIDHPGFQLNSRMQGTTRHADVSGVITEGTANYAAGDAHASLSSINAGELVVLH